MTTEAIAKELKTLLEEGKFEDIYNTLFHQEKVKHIEPQSLHFPELVGVKAIKEKDTVMTGNIEEVTSLEIGDYVTSKNFIAIPYKISLTLKNGDERALDELIIYQVEEGKIILEQFFY
ncbi:SnoaL-like domain-containing protein [Aquimarina spongiae]|uniref:SnoaL-like domain-containing protein n=1 Tax=Aquimarina spongiae TaxID=570521 RepID=A0A1M6CH40_9FLAO|nr:SnoaL-like domain-containing protein [Aquimarina spongiae]SHI60296.1 hypothetical protein SAMN04488508_102113 [Aquimarina spongiae]